jgi:CRP-like cAMP-binding protein
MKARPKGRCFDPNQGQIILADLGPGELFGAIAFLDGKPR